MRPMFTVHAGEFLVGQHIETSFKDKRVWLPSKDTGVDLLVTNARHSRSVTLQVKFSRDFLPIMKLAASTRQHLRACTWFSFDRNKIARSPADFWVLVLLGFENKSRDYLVVRPKELLKRLDKLHGKTARHQVYVWITDDRRAWLTRGLSMAETKAIGEGMFGHRDRDVSRFLNNWSPIHRL
ncbi:hypothetical protein IVB36_20200 [Bradyrhizobium sp. 35]|uniref:hypothetical protein n=1 Tax=Bradyrhizobium sp. 35 TaxID=2782670 RepID=UPI001FFB586C|nr:hypothetical protein [Bradyrhizobium sp. 35]MCK1453158.1 hypothetical protein [Bradyrhizobium sp. 35]